MKWTCNIEARGSRIRGISGTVFMAIAILLALAAWITGWSWLWWPTGGFGIGGALQLFEASHSWCVVRAMGIKTKI